MFTKTLSTLKRLEQERDRQHGRYPKLRTLLARALRDGRSCTLRIEYVEELCNLLKIAPAKVSAYQRRRMSVTVKSDEQMTISKLQQLIDRRVKSDRVRAKHRRLRQRMEDEERQKPNARRGRGASW